MTSHTTVTGTTTLEDDTSAHQYPPLQWIWCPSPCRSRQPPPHQYQGQSLPHTNSVHHNSVQYVWGFDIGPYLGTGGPTKHTTDDEVGNTEHDDDDDYGSGWIYTVRRCPGVALGKAHLEGEGRWMTWEDGRCWAGWWDDDWDTDTERQRWWTPFSGNWRRSTWHHDCHKKYGCTMFSLPTAAQPAEHQHRPPPLHSITLHTPES